MLKADIAECILSLTTTPERAASTAGDLAEDAETRGALWFWRVLLGTTVSLVGQTWAGSPRRLAGLAFRACLVAFGFSLAIGLGTVISLVVLGNLAKVLFAAYGYEYLRVVMVAGPFVGGAISQFLAGKWIGRRAPSSELAACIGFLFLQQVPIAILSFLLSSPTENLPAKYATVAIIANIAPFVGIWWARRQTARTATSS